MLGKWSAEYRPPVLKGKRRRAPRGLRGALAAIFRCDACCAISIISADCDSMGLLRAGTSGAPAREVPRNYAMGMGDSCRLVDILRFWGLSTYAAWGVATPMQFTKRISGWVVGGVGEGRLGDMDRYIAPIQLPPRGYVFAGAANKI